MISSAFFANIHFMRQDYVSKLTSYHKLT